MTIAEAIKKLAAQPAEAYCKICTVDAVDETARTVDVSPLDESAPILGVNLHSVQDAGVDLECTSDPADKIKQTWTVYYDPQVLDGSGNRLDGTAQDVVRTAIVSYVQSLPFNGLYAPALQQVNGVRVPVIDRNEVSEDNGGTWAAPATEGVIPKADWYKFYGNDDLIINMKPYLYGENV